jgi:hypothetical protein
LGKSLWRALLSQERLGKELWGKTFVWKKLYVKIEKARGIAENERILFNLPL